MPLVHRVKFEYPTCAILLVNVLLGITSNTRMGKVENNPVEFEALLIYQHLHGLRVQFRRVDPIVDFRAMFGQFPRGLLRWALLVFLVHFLPSVVNRRYQVDICVRWPSLRPLEATGQPVETVGRFRQVTGQRLAVWLAAEPVAERQTEGQIAVANGQYSLGGGKYF